VARIWTGKLGAWVDRVLGRDPARDAPEVPGSRGLQPDAGEGVVDPYDVTQVAHFALAIIHRRDVYNRRVEQIEALSESRFRRRISVDITIPDYRPANAPVPLLVLPSRALHAFSVRAEDGRTVPVLTKSQAVRIQREMEVLTGADADEPNSPEGRYVKALFERGFLLWIHLELPDGQSRRTVFKVDYENEGWFHKLRRRELTRRHEGPRVWTSTFATHALEPLPASYHAEISAPEGLWIVRFGRVVIQSGGVSTVWEREFPGHLYCNDEQELRRTSGVVVDFAIAPSPLRYAAICANAFTMTILTAGLLLRWIWGVGADAPSLAAVILVVPALLGAIVLQTPVHQLTSRIFAALRNLVLFAITCDLLATGILTLDTGKITEFPLKQATWVTLAVLSALATIHAIRIPLADYRWKRKQRLMVQSVTADKEATVQL